MKSAIQLVIMLDFGLFKFTTILNIRLNSCNSNQRKTNAKISVYELAYFQRVFS